MKQEPNITFVAGQHGNEYLPVLALVSHKIPFIAANPRALAIGKRTVGRDLNASFGVSGTHYEAKQARAVLKQIPSGSYVVDFHTSVAAKKPFVILVDPKMLSLAVRTGVQRIVYMKFSTKRGRALINHRNGVSVEVGQDKSKTSFTETLQVVKNLKRSVSHPRRFELYEVYGKITKPGKYVNFRLHSDGFIPVLAREPSLRFYGLKAKRVSSFS